jgi:hypothetical protein
MEQETKRCPYCGEEIMAVAKKCKHCGEWLTNKKPNRKKASQPKVNVSETEHKGKVSSFRDDVRVGNTQADWNKENAEALPVQALIIGVLLGIAYKSWWIGGGTFFGLLILLQIPYIGTFICILLSLIYGFIGYIIGTHFFSTSAGWVIGIFVGLGTLAMNLSSKQWIKDLSDE